MFKLLAKWVVHAIALSIVAYVVEGFVISDFWAAMVAVVVIAFINTLIKPILILFTLPITILTLGLFTLIINAALLLLASAITPGFAIDGFFTALVGSIVLSIVTILLNSLVS